MPRSNPITIRIQSTPPAVAANTVLNVGTNQMQDARPSGWGAQLWLETMFWQYSGGALVPGWGNAGAFVMAAHGGHSTSTKNSVDASIFDFNDFTWKCLLNTNGVTHSPVSWTEANIDSTGGHQALLGTSQQVPPASHTYRMSLGVGSSLILPRVVYGLESGNGGARSWRCQLNFATQDCTWSRLADNNPNSFYYMPYDQEWITSHYDVSRGRIWQFSATMAEATSVATIRPGIDTLWSGVNYSGLSGVAMQVSGSIYGSIITDEGNDCFWLIGANGQLYRMNRSTSAMTWTTQTSTGLASTAYTGTGSSSTKTRWHQYPIADGGDGCFYTHAHAGVSRLKRFNPATRVFDLVDIANGPTMISWDTGQPGHYSRFGYNSYLKCFYWIPSGNQPVQLVRP